MSTRPLPYKIPEYFITQKKTLIQKLIYVLHDNYFFVSIKKMQFFYLNAKSSKYINEFNVNNNKTVKQSS